MKLLEALELHTFPQVISIIGAGGKTSTMTALAMELAAMGKKVLVTTTTHIGREQGEGFPALIIETDYGRAREKIGVHMDEGRPICLVSHGVEGNKYKGISTAWVDRLARESLLDAIIVEGDGAKGRSFKAPGTYEPVIPKSTTRSILVIGLDALGQPITEEFIHRPEIVGQLLGISSDLKGILLSEEYIHRVIFHPQGLLKKLNVREDIAILLNKVERQKEEQAVGLAKEIIEQGRHYQYRRLRVLIGEVQNPEVPIRIRLDGKS